MAFSPANICVPRAWCFQNYLIGALSLLSVVCVLVVLWRNCRRRQKRATELSTPVGRLLEHLTITLFILDLLYHAPDLLFPMDTEAPPLWFMMKVSFKDRDVGHSLIFQFTREGMGMLSVFWHSQIAYSLCSSILGERSAPRLMRMQLWNQVLIMMVVTGIRYLLYYQGGEAGVVAAVLMYDVLVVPVCITTMLYYYSVAVVRLHTGAGSKGKGTSAVPPSEQTATSQPPAQPPPHRPLIPWAAIVRRLRFAMPPDDEALEGAVASLSPEDQQQGVVSSDAKDGSSGSANVEAGVGSANVEAGVGDTKDASGVQGPPHIQGSRSIQRREIRRHRSIIRRLLHISLAVALTWLLGTIIDLICWLAWLIADRTVSDAILPSWLFIAGIIMLRLVGLIDAVVLGGLCDIGRSRKKKKTRFHGHLPVVVGNSVSHAEATHSHRQRSEASPFYRHRASSMSADGGMYSCVSSSHYRSSLDYSYAEESTASQKSTSRAYVEARALAMQTLSRSASVSNVSRSISFSFMDPYSSATSVSKDYTSALRNASPGRQTVRVFATTWNLGCVTGGELRSELPRMLASWIPLGYDLYVLGVQECLCLKDLKALVHQHLGGSMAYSLVTEVLAERRVMHGLIAVMVLARREDVLRGVFEVRSRPVSIVGKGAKMGRGTHKGSVAMSVRYHDTSLALLCAHFASDSKGRSRVARRNKEACSMLRNMSLSWDCEEFDVHLQHHHVLLLGDLNYRLNETPLEVLSLVAQAASLEAKSAGGQWRRSSYGRFELQQQQQQQPHRKGLFVKHLSPVFGERKPHEWAWISRLDELSRLMEQRQVFCGFHEGSIRYPPPYRRKRAADGGAYTDLKHLQSVVYSISSASDACEPDDDAEDTRAASTRKMDVQQPGKEMAGGGAESSEKNGLDRSTSAVPDGAAMAAEPLTATASWGERVESAGSAKQKEPEAVYQRTPSYTDRVLTHSLPGMAARLRWRHYDMADAVMLSDHRPVAASFEVHVDLRRAEEQADCLVANSCYVSSTTHTGPVGVSRLANFCIVFDRPRFEAYRPRSSSMHTHSTRDSTRESWPRPSSSPVSDAPVGLTVLFPLACEDPLVTQRHVAGFGEALPGVLGLTCTTSAFSPLASQATKSKLPATQPPPPTTTSLQPAEVMYTPTDSPVGTPQVQSPVSSRLSDGSPSIARQCLRRYSPSSFPAVHKIVACPERSEHMLVKASDVKGRCLGQGVVSVTKYKGGEMSEARVELSSGGAITGYLHLRLKVQCVLAE